MKASYSHNNLNEGSYYIDRIIKKINISKENFYKLCNVYLCSKCYCYSIHPWLTNSQSNIQFTTSISSHNAGWAQFEDSLAKSEANYYLTHLNDAIKNILIKSNVKTYAEVGCPFNGAFILQNYKRQQLIRDSYIEILKDKSSSLISKIYYFNNLPARYINTICIKLRFLYHNKKNKKNKKINYLDLKGVKKYIIRIDTNLGWNYNCVKYDSTCYGFAAGLMDVEPVGLSLALEEKLKFDVIGVYNYLDHCDRPLKVLESLLALSSRLLISTHNEKNAGFQHAFAFTNNFFELFLREELKTKYSVKKISSIYKNETVTDNIYEIRRLDL